MSDIVEQARRVVELRGSTYSSYEVISLLGGMAAEIERLRAHNAVLTRAHERYEQDVRLRHRIEQLEAAGNAAFMAMCAFRDRGDEECFQDAIDDLGYALEGE